MKRNPKIYQNDIRTILGKRLPNLRVFWPYEKKGLINLPSNLMIRQRGLRRQTRQTKND